MVIAIMMVLVMVSLNPFLGILQVAAGCSHFVTLFFYSSGKLVKFLFLARGERFTNLLLLHVFLLAAFLYLPQVSNCRSKKIILPLLYLSSKSPASGASKIVLFTCHFIICILLA
jgi:hypothetical protein